MRLSAAMASSVASRRTRSASFHPPTRGDTTADAPSWLTLEVSAWGAVVAAAGAVDDDHVEGLPLFVDLVQDAFG